MRRDLHIRNSFASAKIENFDILTLLCKRPIKAEHHHISEISFRKLSSFKQNGFNTKVFVQASARHTRYIL